MTDRQRVLAMLSRRLEIFKIEGRVRMVRWMEALIKEWSE